MKAVMFCFLGGLSLFAVQANASSNFGLYEKLYDVGDESVYARIWGGYDPAIYQETIRPGDFRVSGSSSGCFPGEADELCENSLLTQHDALDTIVVIGRRLQRYVYIFQSAVNTGPGSLLEIYGRAATPGATIGNYVRLGNIVISAEKLAELAAQVHNLTIQWALADIQRFRATGLHVGNPVGSVIPWQTARVNWNDYGANNPNLSDRDVLQNLINALGQP